MYRKLILALSLFFTPVALADTTLDAALNAYLDEDYSKMGVIEDYAMRGDVEAQGAIGQALWYGIGVKKDRVRALSFLKSAANAGDRVSAVQLGRIYKLGHSDAPKDLDEAAKWFVMAAMEGETITAPRELKSMPRDIVVAAGGAEWAAPAPGIEPAPVRVTTEKPQAGLYSNPEAFKEVIPDPAPAPTPTPPPAPQKEPELSAKDKASMSLIEAIFGDSDYGLAAPDYVLQDGSRFRVLTDTALSTSGDVAASCHVVLSEYMMTKSEILEPMLNEINAGNRSRYAQALKLSLELEKLVPFSEMAASLVKDSSRNGGLSMDAANSAYAEHSYAFDMRPEDAPGVEACQVRMTGVLADIALSEAEGRYWGK